MASTYTTSLALQLMATGENAGTWGQITNTNLTLVQQAIAGYQAVSIAGGAQTTALVMTQNALANARNIVIKLTGAITGNQIVTIPNNITKTWIVSNGTTGAFTVQFKYASTGTGQTWSTTDKGIKILYADGTDIQLVDLSTLSGTIVAAQITNSTITTTKIAASTIVANNIAASTITAAKLAANSVYANQIVQSTITQTKLAASSVGSNQIAPAAVGPTQLANTAVVAGSYTTASITVDAQGRLTAASTGTGGGAGMGIPTLYKTGPSSGTYTAAPTANRIGVYMLGAGGGGGQQGNCSNSAGTGGSGGYGFWNKPITQPFSQPYSLGAGGNAPSGPYSPGNAGGATTLTNVGTANGGNGGVGGNTNTPLAPGNPGTAPGASLTFNPSGNPSIQFLIGPGFGGGGAGGTSPNRGSSGQGGALVVFENTGT